MIHPYWNGHGALPSKEFFAPQTRRVKVSGDDLVDSTVVELVSDVYTDVGAVSSFNPPTQIRVYTDGGSEDEHIADEQYRVGSGVTFNETEHVLHIFLVETWDTHQGLGLYRTKT